MKKNLIKKKCLKYLKIRHSEFISESFQMVIYYSENLKQVQVDRKKFNKGRK